MQPGMNFLLTELSDIEQELRKQTSASYMQQ